MHTDRAMSNPWKLDEVILKAMVKGTFWKRKIFWKAWICALVYEQELRQALLIRRASHRMAFCQRDRFPQTGPDQTPGNAREPLCTTASAPRAIEAQAAGCTMEKADAGNQDALSSSRPSLPSLHSPASQDRKPVFGDMRLQPQRGGKGIKRVPEDSLHQQKEADKLCLYEAQF